MASDYFCPNSQTARFRRDVAAARAEADFHVQASAAIVAAAIDAAPKVLLPSVGLQLLARAACHGTSGYLSISVTLAPARTIVVWCQGKGWDVAAGASHTVAG